MSRILRASLAVLAGGLLSWSTLSGQETGAIPVSDDIDFFVEDALDRIGVPAGVALAVYTLDGVHSQGFGLADAESGEPATADTAFYIASSTKSFNALAMNVLHHRGEIDLDATLAEYAPEAPFPAEVRPDEVTLRDLLTHTSGIANDPIVFRSAFTGQHTQDVLWDLLAASRVNEEAPHGTFQYTNTGYNILTLLTDRKLGLAWQDLLAREIVRPLGMTRTTAYMSEAERQGWPVARPHGPADGNAMAPLYLHKVDATMQSAGGMIMRANDALLWLELLVNEGRAAGEQVLPTGAVSEIRERRVEVAQQFGPYLREDYGLGWYVSAYDGDLMIHHFGGFAGFRAHVSYLPERGVGVAVFVNHAATGFMADAIANYAYDRLAGRRAGEAARAEIIAPLADRHRQMMAAVAEDRRARAARRWMLSEPMAAYAGTFVSSEMGTIEISVEQGVMAVQMGVLNAVAEPFTVSDTARVELVPLAGRVLSFELEAGEVRAVKLAGAEFKRQ